MSKTMRIQVLMEPELLTKVKTYAVENKIPYKNDSQMIGNILESGITDLSDMKLTIYLMRQQLEERKIESMNLLKQMEYTATVSEGLIKENEILKRNLKAKKGVKK